MKACSRVRAMGPWQFMDETGREYGLRVDYWVDERYDLEKSTVAAARYLKKLFDQFGCWYLVAAGYNGGENKVKKAIEDHRTRDFWRLREYNALPRETQEYVPQLIAAALIAKEPWRYGFGTIPSTPVYRLTKVSVPGGLPLKDIAHASSVDLADLRALNPELLQRITPPDKKRYQIILPGDEEKAHGVSGLRWERRVVRVLQHPVTAKDSVTGIERLYHVTGPDLLLVNADGLRIETQGASSISPTLRTRAKRRTRLEAATRPQGSGRRRSVFEAESYFFVLPLFQRSIRGRRSTGTKGKRDVKAGFDQACDPENLISPVSERSTTGTI